jgi:hypothetical protein
MATTAIIAEILVTGLQATVWLAFASLSATGLNWITEETVIQLQDWAGLITVFVLGFAYTLGIIVDRVADSLLHPIDKRFRPKRFGSKLPSVANARLEVMSKNEELTRFLDFVRSRMRLARATCLNLILITLTAAVLLATQTSAGYLEIMGAVAGGLILFSLSAFAWRRISQTYYKRLEQAYKIVLQQQRDSGEAVT